MDEIQYKSEAMKQYLTYIKSIRHQFSEDSVIAAPTAFMWPNAMIETLYSPDRKIKFVNTENPDWESTITPIEKENTVVLDYDYGREIGQDFDTKKGKLIILTDEFRAKK
jgi:hypothetical protein